jgi:hypothetical protein
VAAAEPDRFVTIDTHMPLDEVAETAYREIRARW